jgi:hypothetical protein
MRASTPLPRRRPFLPACAAALGAVFLTANTLAAQPITYLGSPSNAKPPFLPLGSFHHTPINPRAGTKPELVFLGTQIDSSSAVERWAVVKALDQFGTFSAVGTVVTHNCAVTYLYKKLDCGARLNAYGGAASFDFRRARYRSKHVSLSAAELIDHNLRLEAQNRLSRTQLTLFSRYVRPSGYSSWHDSVWYDAAGGPPLTEPSRHFPLVAVGGYVETGANVAMNSDLTRTDGSRSLTFSEVEHTLQTGQPAGGVPNTLVSDTNAEANIITALICHADGRKPAKVCNRPVIRSMLKHVK